ncbi:unannotated protein [freshwater metagenome]|uniref:Unannotated protein n=1 Tax=freshwater metagenome TaxID=449393 RepID=A0A6J7I8C0_9ZZZZ|nr:hypothetical protein [Actinomycetota bacterium]
MRTAIHALGGVPGPVSAAEFIETLGLWDEPGKGSRPRLIAVMVGSADGRASVDGRAGGLSSPADRSVMRELRTVCDALIVGPTTFITERYEHLLDPGQPERRIERGRAPEPLLVTISRSLDPALERVPLLGREGARVRVFTESERDLGPTAAEVEVRRFAPGALTPAQCLEELVSDGVRLAVTEGGPTLLHALIADGLVDDLVLTIAPLVVGGDGPTVLTGPVFEPPTELELRSVLRGEDHIFLHYALRSAR